MNVFELFAKIGLDDSEYKSGLSKAADMGKSVIGGIGNIAKVGFGAVTAAVGAGATAVGAFGTQAVKAYGQYEQLAGGVEKLYGTAAKKVQAFADEAYLSAGMSANEYMETATSFSAALIKSLGGDVDKAADMTDVAMKAMSDNINVFGSDAESVRNTFQSLARGQYQLLDNLKLGYGGSKEGMQELIADANAYRATIGETADLSIDSFADIVTAIQTVQEQQNIAGTTAKEAMTTIEGSATATKAAWENVITAIGRGEGIKEAFSGLKDSLFGTGETADGKKTGLLNQIIPRIETVSEGISDFITEVSPLIATELPKLIDSTLPSLIDCGIQLVGAIGMGIVNAIPSIATSLWNAGEQIVTSVGEGMGGAIPTLGDYISQGASFVGGKFLDLLDKSVQAVDSFDWSGTAQKISNGLVSFIEGDGVTRFIQGAFKLIGGLVTGIGQALPSLIPAAIQAVYSLGNTLIQNVPILINAGLNLIIGLAQGIINAIPVAVQGCIQCWQSIFNVYGQYGSKILDKVKDIFGKVVTNVVTFMQKLPERIAYFAGYAVTSFALALITLPTKAKELFTKVIDKAKEFGTDLKDKAKDAAKNFGDSLIDGITHLPEKMMEWGKKIGEGLVNGFKAMISGIGDLANSAFSGAKAAAEDYKNSQQNDTVQNNTLKSAFKPSNLAETIENTNNAFDEPKTGIDYDILANAIVNAFTSAGITVECDGREFGRLVRKAVTA